MSIIFLELQKKMRERNKYTCFHPHIHKKKNTRTYLLLNIEYKKNIYIISFFVCFNILT